MNKVERIIREYEEDEVRARLAIRILQDIDFYQKVRWLDTSPTSLAQSILYRKPISSKCMPIEDLELPVMAYTCLKRAGIDSVGEICMMSRQALMKLPRIGKSTADQIEKAIEQYGLSLKT